MNRLKMAEEIANRVPTLAQVSKDEWKHLESLRTGFVADFPVRRIPNLMLDEYVNRQGRRQPLILLSTRT
jgi:hypothetical protein